MSPSSVIFLLSLPHYGSSCLWAWWAVSGLLRKLIQICTLVEAKYLQMLHFNPFTMLVCKFFFYTVYLNFYYTNCDLCNWFSSFRRWKRNSVIYVHFPSNEGEGKGERASVHCLTPPHSFGFLSCFILFYYSAAGTWPREMSYFPRLVLLQLPACARYTTLSSTY